MRFVNESAVNITWNAITEVADYIIDGYTVFYTPVTETTQNTREMSNVTFSGGGNSTTYGVIGGLGDSEDGYLFLVVAMTNETELLEHDGVLDLRNVVGLRYRDVNMMMEATDSKNMVRSYSFLIFIYTSVFFVQSSTD